MSSVEAGHPRNVRAVVDGDRGARIGALGLYEKYTFPDMYTSPELGDATNKLIASAKKHNIILGIFLFGTSRVAEFMEKGFGFISVGNDLHHILTQAGAYVKDVEGITGKSGAWGRRPSALL